LQAGDIPNARLEVDDFLKAALSIAEPNMRALAWETKARVAGAEKNSSEAQQCIESALAILDEFDIPVGAWRVHVTAWDLYSHAGQTEKAEVHRARAKRVDYAAC
jgi:tetratricopeptide (TPR) repeat protein